MPAPTRPLGTRKEVAAFLNIPEGTLNQWAHRGIGPRYTRVGGRQVRYDWDDVTAWLNEQEKAGGGAAA